MFSVGAPADDHLAVTGVATNLAARLQAAGRRPARSCSARTSACGWSHGRRGGDPAGARGAGAEGFGARSAPTGSGRRRARQPDVDYVAGHRAGSGFDDAPTLSSEHGLEQRRGAVEALDLTAVGAAELGAHRLAVERPGDRRRVRATEDLGACRLRRGRGEVGRHQPLELGAGVAAVAAARLRLALRLAARAVGVEDDGQLRGRARRRLGLDRRRSRRSRRRRARAHTRARRATSRPSSWLSRPPCSRRFCR